MEAEVRETNWRPLYEQWENIKQLSLESEAVITVSGTRQDGSIKYCSGKRTDQDIC